MITPSSILAWKIPWREESGEHGPWGCKVPDMTEQLIFSLSLPPFVISMMNRAGIILSKICETEKNTMIYM